MLPQSTASLETSQTDTMMAIIEYWDGQTGDHTDNTEKYLLLLLLKLGLDAVVFCLCCRKPFTSFLSTCSLSMVLADLVMVSFIATVWFLGAERSFVSTCFVLANTSATYGALVVPMTFLGLLDYYFMDTYLGKQSTFCTFLRNVVLTLLVWMLAVIYSVGSVKAELMELDNVMDIKALVCPLEESAPINYFILGLFTALICATLPFWSKIPQWVKEADRLSEAREQQVDQRSDLLFTSTIYAETKSLEENYLQETLWPQPPLWFSLTLGFQMFWMPYLAVSVACLIFGFGVPAYITVNVLWVECTNSLLTGLLFWMKRETLGPYSLLPENVCLWQIYWQLSKGPRQQQQQLPIAVFNPAKGKRTIPLCGIREADQRLHEKGRASINDSPV